MKIADVTTLAACPPYRSSRYGTKEEPEQMRMFCNDTGTDMFTIREMTHVIS